MLKRAVIAVVDDDEIVREAVAGLIKSLGHVALAFERAEDFLQSDRGRVAALIADVQMPGMTGPELHNRLVASGQPIPTILITAYPDLETRARALQNGVKCYLSKPFVRKICSTASNPLSIPNSLTRRSAGAGFPQAAPGALILAWATGPFAYGPPLRQGVSAFSTKAGRGEVSAEPDGFLCRLIVDSPGFE